MVLERREDYAFEWAACHAISKLFAGSGEIGGGREGAVVVTTRTERNLEVDAPNNHEASRARRRASAKRANASSRSVGASTMGLT